MLPLIRQVYGFKIWHRYEVKDLDEDEEPEEKDGDQEKNRDAPGALLPLILGRLMAKPEYPKYKHEQEDKNDMSRKAGEELQCSLSLGKFMASKYGTEMR